MLLEAFCSLTDLEIEYQGGAVCIFCRYIKRHSDVTIVSLVYAGGVILELLGNHKGLLHYVSINESWQSPAPRRQSAAPWRSSSARSQQQARRLETQLPCASR